MLTQFKILQKVVLLVFYLKHHIGNSFHFLSLSFPVWRKSTHRNVESAVTHIDVQITYVVPKLQSKIRTMRSLKFLISTPLLLIDHDRFKIRLIDFLQFDLFKTLAAHLISHFSETDLFIKITLINNKLYIIGCHLLNWSMLEIFS